MHTIKGGKMKKMSNKQKRLKLIYEVVKDREDFFKNEYGRWRHYRIAEYVNMSAMTIKKYLAHFNTAKDIKDFLDDNDVRSFKDIEMQRIYYEGYRTGGNYTIREYLKACEHIRKYGLKDTVFL